MTQSKPRSAPPLDALANLAHFHREHEKVLLALTDS